jgi:lytic murein transglycosylase
MRTPIVMAALAALWAGTATTPANAHFESCVAGLKQAAISGGVSKAVAARALDGTKPHETVLRLSKSQPEFKTPIWDYFGFLVDEDRIRDGQAMMRKHDKTLREAERRFGVDRHVIAAVWGVETDYGTEMGDIFLPQALATLACQGERRQSFWRGQLTAALKLVDRGDVKLDKLYGSWAGAFGHTQFIPTTYQSLAVDFDGDGKRDLINSIPDALGSTANFLKNAGWRQGESWLIEVKVPKGYKGASGRKNKAALSTWAKRGVVRADGSGLSGNAQAGLLLPAGANGPGFLVFRNFDAIFSYNNAESYALAISHLADRLAGYPALRTSWPTDDAGLSRAERIDLQRLLASHGYYEGEVSGKVGPITRAAIADAEKSLQMKPTGRAGQRIYRALQAGRTQ